MNDLAQFQPAFNGVNPYVRKPFFSYSTLSAQAVLVVRALQRTTNRKISLSHFLTKKDPTIYTFLENVLTRFSESTIKIGI
jgi:hypothetical protein